jgi:hypothetical protein
LVVWVAGMFAAAALTAAAGAQPPAGLPPAPASPYAPRLVLVTTTTVAPLGVQTTVAVPDGGTVSLGGYSRVSEGRREYGPPGLGKLPYAGRGFRNIGYGRSTVNVRGTVSVRVIDLREEEYRQTGYRGR